MRPYRGIREKAFYFSFGQDEDDEDAMRKDGRGERMKKVTGLIDE